MPGFIPQPWWSPPGPSLHRPSGVQVAVGQPAAMVPGMPYPSSMAYGTMPGVPTHNPLLA